MLATAIYIINELLPFFWAPGCDVTKDKFDTNKHFNTFASPVSFGAFGDEQGNIV